MNRFEDYYLKDLFDDISPLFTQEGAFIKRVQIIVWF